MREPEPSSSASILRGATARVAGDNVEGPDIFLTNSATGNSLTTVQVKSFVSARSFEGEVKDELVKPIGSVGASEVIAVQVPIGSNTSQLLGKLRSNFSNYDFTGRSILVVDSAGNVLIPLTKMSNLR